MCTHAHTHICTQTYINKNTVRKRSLSVIRNPKKNAKPPRVFSSQQRLGMELSRGAVAWHTRVTGTDLQYGRKVLAVKTPAYRSWGRTTLVSQWQANYLIYLLKKTSATECHSLFQLHELVYFRDMWVTGLQTHGKEQRWWIDRWVWGGTIQKHREYPVSESTEGSSHWLWHLNNGKEWLSHCDSQRKHSVINNLLFPSMAWFSNYHGLKSEFPALLGLFHLVLWKYYYLNIQRVVTTWWKSCLALLI